MRKQICHKLKVPRLLEQASEGYHWFICSSKCSTSISKLCCIPSDNTDYSQKVYRFFFHTLYQNNKKVWKWPKICRNEQFSLYTLSLTVSVFQAPPLNLHIVFDFSHGAKLIFINRGSSILHLHNHWATNTTTKFWDWASFTSIRDFITLIF